MCKYSNLYIISGKNAFPSKQFLPLGPLASALFGTFAFRGNASDEDGSESPWEWTTSPADYHRKKERSDEICIFEGLQRFCTLSQSHTGIIVCTSVFYECKNCMNVGRVMEILQLSFCWHPVWNGSLMPTDLYTDNDIIQAPKPYIAKKCGQG